MRVSRWVFPTAARWSRPMLIRSGPPASDARLLGSFQLMLTLRMYAADVAELPSDLDSALAELGADYRRVLDHGIEAQAEALGLPRELLARPGFRPVVRRYRRAVRRAACHPGGGDGCVCQRAAIRSRQRSTAALRRWLSRDRPVALRARKLALGALRHRDLAESLRISALRAASVKRALEPSPRRPRSSSTPPVSLRTLPCAASPTRSQPRAAVFLGARCPSSSRPPAGLALRRSGPLSKHRASRVRSSWSRAPVASRRSCVCRHAAPSRRWRQAGARCACGRPLSDERVEEVVMLTERGRGLLTSSRWMVLLLVSNLHALGIEYARNDRRAAA